MKLKYIVMTYVSGVRVVLETDLDSYKNTSTFYKKFDKFIADLNTNYANLIFTRKHLNISSGPVMVGANRIACIELLDELPKQPEPESEYKEVPIIKETVKKATRRKKDETNN